MDEAFRSIRKGFLGMLPKSPGQDEILQEIVLDTRLGVNMFGRDFTLLPSTLAREALELRVARGNVFAGMIFQAGAAFLVKGQVIEMVKDIRFSFASLLEEPVLRIRQNLVRIGESTFDLKYTFHVYHNRPGGSTNVSPVKEELIANAFVSLVCINANGKRAKIPVELPFQLPPVDENEDLSAKFRTAMRNAPKPEQLIASASKVYTVTPRFQDEDFNGHVNHASYFRFFEDAVRDMMEESPELFLSSRGVAPKLFGVEYVKESFQGQQLTLLVNRLRPGILVMHLLREKNVVVSRAWWVENPSSVLAAL